MRLIKRDDLSNIGINKAPNNRKTSEDLQDGRL